MVRAGKYKWKLIFIHNQSLLVEFFYSFDLKNSKDLYFVRLGVVLWNFNFHPVLHIFARHHKHILKFVSILLSEWLSKARLCIDNFKQPFTFDTRVLFSADWLKSRVVNNWIKQRKLLLKVVTQKLIASRTPFWLNIQGRVQDASLLSLYSDASENGTRPGRVFWRLPDASLKWANASRTRPKTRLENASQKLPGNDPDIHWSNSM